ncbi:hypothetical protein ACQPZG_15315 [Streptomyces sp. CA-294286]|uniref:hypothetical protein n=1 Tax=Streptomyces sp. CA-294286 TaxID=3240070 RepID=UPI003D90EA01
MGSLRNPVGPLPSSIYWRRRVVGLALLALLVALVLWAVLAGGGNGDNNGRGGGGPSPAASITPGPSGSGPVVPGEPGGRDTAGGDGGSGTNGGTGGGSTGSGGTASGGAGAGGADGTGGAEGSGGGTGGSSASGGTAAGAASGGGAQLPANSPLPHCAAGAVELTIRAREVQVPAGENPKFELIAKNTSAADCKVDLGPKAAVIKIKNAKNETVWSSKDCPKGATTLLFRVPAKGEVPREFEWDRTRSDATKCDKGTGGPVEPGTYLVELAGAKNSASIFLQKD